MKNVYISRNLNGIEYVREILPAEATPVAQWYNEEFASHCVEAPDEVEEYYEYDRKNGLFYPPGEYPQNSINAVTDVIRTSVDQI